MITALTSISGSPGVTTTALGLTLAWPRASLLVDADHQQAILAGYLRGREPGDRGLTQVISAAHRGANLQEAIWLASRPLPDDSPTQRRLLLPGPAAPWERAAVDRRWDQLGDAFTGLSAASGVDVLIDLGRLPTPTTNTPSTLLPAHVLETVDVLVVMLHPTLRAVAAARTMLAGLRDAANTLGVPDRVVLVLRAPTRGVDHFSAREISDATHVPVVGQVDGDPAAAAVLSEGQPRTRRWDANPLNRSYHRLANHLATNPTSIDLDQDEEEIA